MTRPATARPEAARWAVVATADAGSRWITEASANPTPATARAPRAIRSGERIHVVGVAGAGASAAALLARAAGAVVSGCDAGGKARYVHRMSAQISIFRVNGRCERLKRIVIGMMK